MTANPHAGNSGGRCVLAAKQRPHRPGIPRAPGLRARSDDPFMVSRTAIELEAFPMWLRSLFRHFGAGRNAAGPNRIRPRSPRRRPAWLPFLERLEDRTVPSCFTFEQITQIHHHPQILEELDPAISGDGTRIAFQSFADLTGENADGTDEIFLFDTVTGRLTQVTRASERF